GREHLGRGLGELAGELPRVVRERDLEIHLARIDLFDIAGERRRRLSDVIDVHPVGAGAEDAAHAPRPELQISVEALGELLLVAFFEESRDLAAGHAVESLVGRPVAGARSYGCLQCHGNSPWKVNA